MTLNGVMAVTLRYFSEVGKPALQKTICGGIYARVYCILVRVQCPRKESSRSLSHLLMSFLYIQGHNQNFIGGGVISPVPSIRFLPSFFLFFFPFPFLFPFP